MKQTYYIFDSNSNVERKLEKTNFPLTVDGSEKADIQLPGCATVDGQVYIDLDGDKLVMRPSDESGAYLNGQIVSEPHRLKNGDTIRLGTSLLRCDFHRQRVTFTIDPITEKIKRPPPEHIIRSKKDDEEKEEPIVPVEFTPTQNEHPPETKKPRVFPAILAALFGLLLLLAGFVFTATSVTVQVDPLADHLELDDGPFSFRLGKRFLAWPGSYRIKAEKTGYHSLNEPLEVIRGASMERSFSLKKQNGLLSISTTPVNGAQIVIDGSPAGITPLAEVELTPGMHQISIQAERYQKAARNVEISGAATQQQLNVELLPNWAVVKLGSEPTEATVIVDGKVMGTTPATLDLLTGSHQLEIKKEGFESWLKEVVAVAEHPQDFPKIKLSKAKGIVALKTEPVGVNVTVDGNFIGQTPLNIRLTPDEIHKVSLFKPGYKTVVRKVEVSAAKKQSLRVNLPTDYGRISLANLPEDAQLFIDGNLKINDPDGIQLTTVPHQIEVRKKGFIPFKTTLTPRSGFPQQLDITMITESTKVASKAQATQLGQKLVYIQPGRFTMGASRREQGRRANEVLHDVTLTRPFYIGTKEVSNAEFRKFKTNHYSGSIQGVSLDGNQHPVVQVTWNNAARYCNWLSKKESLPPVYQEKEGIMVARQPIPNGYRLPTEAEWAMVARFAKQTKPLKYPWGGSFPPPANSGNYGLRDDYSATAPVGSFKTNRLGLYDIGGNVSEWVHDFYGVFSGTSTTPQKDPVGPSKGKHHVIRGSSWHHGSISELRLSYRDYSSKERSDVGFRIARYTK
ncbi:MAG: SUMF1/EgtB/PvdO family nonheme iron enzyme [Methylococcales bacterium]